MTEAITNKIKTIFSGKRILILGFGKEGQSTYKFLRGFFPETELLIADRNPDSFGHLSDKKIITFSGEDYLQAVTQADLIMKSPGISFKEVQIPDNVILSSQTDLFINLFKNQIVGVTGTKGKSTVVSLIKHILSAFYTEVKLVGNIGVPALDIIDAITPEMKIIYELSSHQLEFSNFSPHISVLLNLYEEHLDHYRSYEDYRRAKWQIALHQKVDDLLILNCDDPTINSDIRGFELNSKQITISSEGNIKADFYFDGNEIYHGKTGIGFDTKKFKLPGKHNVYNLMVALAAANLLGIEVQEALSKAEGFKGLPHRLEFLRNFHGVDFINDSIATIPQATINAIKSVDNLQTLILGGFDRGISYDLLVDFLFAYKPLNIILLGEVGVRLKKALEGRNYTGNLFLNTCFDEAVEQSFAQTTSGNACLLSPAAASYDKFKNFEERGNRFRQLVNGLKKSFA